MKTLTFIAAFALALARTASAQTADQYNQLKQQIDGLQKQVEGLKASGTQIMSREPKKEKLEWGGFGEMAYQNIGARQENGSASPYHDIANLTRISIDGIYHFNDQVRAKFEVEVLNAGVNSMTTNSLSKNISVDIEQAFVDDKLSEAAGLRAGLVIVPMGLTNDHHRPDDYDGVFRPSTEIYLIPSTWRELGAGLFGTFGPEKMVSYRSYVVSGFNPVAGSTSTTYTPNIINQVTGFTGSQAIKGGRSLGTIGLAKDGAWVTRVDVSPVKGSFVGASYYVGQAGQGQVSSEIPIEIWEAHAHGEYRNARLQALFVQGNIGNAGQLDAIIKNNSSVTAKDYVGGRFWGGYVSLDYNVMPLIKPEGLKGLEHLGPYFRFERYSTAAHLPAGYAGNGANDRTEWTVGLSARPIKNVLLKAEYQWLNNSAHQVGAPALVENGQLPLTGVHEFNLGLAYTF